MIAPGIKTKYTNYKGEVSIREIAPCDVPQFLATEFHPERQWIMRAWDYSKGAYRDFALQDCDFTVERENKITHNKDELTPIERAIFKHGLATGLTGKDNFNAWFKSVTLVKLQEFVRQEFDMKE
jgi:hypothetical protein